MKQSLSKRKLADSIWARYNSALVKGHSDYQKQAKLCENFFLGGGRHWDSAAKAELEAVGRPYLEENLIFSIVNTVVGYQTQSRMDITYKPRENGDSDIAEILSKLSMYVLDNNKYPWTEKQVFEDGIIQQRGYLDIRVDFENNYLGEIKITSKDPLDIIPDQDAKGYDPDTWSDVIETRWMSLDDIAVAYGNSFKNSITAFAEADPDFGIGEIGVERNKFGAPSRFSSYYLDETDIIHVRVLERQWYKLVTRYFWVNSESGDMEPVPDDMPLKEAQKDNREVVRRLVKRIRWTVSTKDTVLHDDWSPYEHFTIVPYFPFFRRGQTLGLVDNLISTQQMLNKIYSQILHVINTTANSGWVVEQNSLSNMDTEDLEDYGAKTGLVIEYKQGREKPDKIEPNAIPSGLRDMVNSGMELIQMISGVTPSFKGEKGPEVSGDAIQSRVQQAATQLASPIDNLFLTRHLLGVRLVKLIQSFYTEERIINITGESEEEDQQLAINYENEIGEITNDITIGKYDVVVADVPTAVTFQNAQFREAVELRKYGIMIPDSEMIKMSTLSRKNQIVKDMTQKSPAQEQMQQEQMNAALEELKKKIEKLEADTVSRKISSYKSAAETAQLLVQNPELIPIIESLMSQSKEEEPEQMEEAQQESMTPQSAPVGDTTEIQQLG